MSANQSATLVLIHSPFTAALTWLPVAETLERRGAKVIVPSLVDALDADSNFCRVITACVAKALEASKATVPILLVAHSAAGSFVPVIRAALPYDVRAYLFVDARLPQKDASLFDTSPPAMVEQVRAMAKEGWLPPWSEWFGPDAMREIVPDAVIRQRFVAESRRIPLGLFDEPIPVFSGWPDASCGYIHFGEVYAPEIEQARALGWPTLGLDGRHLHMLVDPHAVAGALLDLLTRLS